MSIFESFRSNCPIDRKLLDIQMVVNIVVAQAQIRIKQIAHFPHAKIVIRIGTIIISFGEYSGFVYVAIFRTIGIVSVGIVKSMVTGWDITN